MISRFHQEESNRLAMRGAALNMLNSLKGNYDELVISLEDWKKFIIYNPNTTKYALPEHEVSVRYVVIRRTSFRYLVNAIGNVYYRPKRLPKCEGGCWYADKMAFKKRMSRKDMYDAGFRVSGSYGSRQ